MKPKKKSAATLRAPRNPLVAAAQMRHAGSHRPSNKAVRAQHKRDTLRTVHSMNTDTYSAGEFARAF